ncbi:hypothetical protein [Metabacillus malikii]|uniref:Uncharacterized protein n=1 Tax=Metabacillus malikii TaxID=1504265 RepID=A0ABT9ZHB9_9BACI|nr:hypothetical protein [Metabacillus malikii]MDQ0231687.1 hypothetical protein [Metabacillus malikii]
MTTMLYVQIIVSACVLLIGRLMFYQFVRKDPWYVLALRYCGYIGLTIISNLFIGVFWTWIWIIGLPLVGLVSHFIFIKVKGFHFLKPGEEYDKYRGWK